MNDQDQDFSAFMLSETSVVAIDLPTGDPMNFPTGSTNRVRVHVFGPTSDQFTKAHDAQQRFIAANVQVKRNGAVKNATQPEDAREQDAKFLSAITQQMENFPYPGGPIAVYRDQRFAYIADQVRAHLNDQTNFFGSKPTA